MKKNYIAILVVFAFLFSLSFVVLAQMPPATGIEIPTPTVEKPQGQQEPSRVQERRTDVEIHREKVQDFLEIKEQKTQQIREKQEEFVREVHQKKEQVLKEVQERRESFEAKVQEIRNERLRQRTRILFENINRVNQNLSKSYTGFLNALELVLGKIESRTKKIEDATGSDLSLVYVKIEEIRQMIKSAWDAIAEQESKTYVPELESEDTMVENFRETIQQVHRDHQQLREEYISPLRQSVKEVMLVLRDAVARKEIEQFPDELEEEEEEELEEEEEEELEEEEEIEEDEE